MRICAPTFLTVSLLLLTAGCSHKKEVRSVSMGEKAEVGSFVYQAIDTSWPMTLAERTPKERFFVVRMTITNTGGTDTTIPGFEVVDDQGNSYPESADGAGLEKWLGMSRKIRVAGTEQADILFDVPPKHYRLRVADENDNFMYIDIPLNLNSEAPARSQLQELK
jgi:hypothetical protein